jgi:hypothetical protein
MGKVKVVDVSPEEPEESKEEVKEEVKEEEVKEEVKPETKEEIKEEVKEVKPKAKRAPPKPKVEPPPPPPPPEPPKKEKTGDKIVTCEKCNKSMKLKSLKYSHKCEKDIEVPQPKKKVAIEQQQAEVREYVPSATPTFNDFRIEQTKLVALARQQRLEVKQQRVKNLISQAI